MNLIEFKQIVENTKLSNPIWFELEMDSLATEQDIKEAESTLKVIFSEQYKDFVREFGGGEFALSNIFSLDNTGDWNLVQINKDIGLLERDFLAISDNQVGDYYGVHIENSRCSEEIYFYDHECNNIISTEYKDLYSFIVSVAFNNKNRP